jgi:hypothetical protein
LSFEAGSFAMTTPAQPTPIDSETLDGIDEIYQRFEQADTAQVLVCLENALQYGAESLPLHLEALYHDAIAVRVKAYTQLQSIAGREGRSPSQLAQWLQTFQDIIEPDEVQTALERGIPLFSGDVVYKVYVSAFDYDDQYYSLLDSMGAVLTHDFQYGDFSADSLPLIAVSLFPDRAQQIADDFHQTILERKPYQEFVQKHSVLLKENPYRSPHYVEGSDYYLIFSDYYRNFEQPVRNWCVEHAVDMVFEYESDHFEEQAWVIDYLTESKDYQRLSEFCEFVGIGKFAFVDESIVLPEVEYFKL